MSDRGVSAGGWITPKVEVRHDVGKGGHSVIAKEHIAQGELVAVWGGDVVTYDELEDLNRIRQRYSVQVEENLYLVTTRENDPADYINHSCVPNLGMRGQIALVAMREIEPGEEIAFDYAMTDGSPYDEFLCACGTPECRGYVSGDDWKRPDLWARYEGFFSPYLQRRIDRLRAAQQQSANR